MDAERHRRSDDQSDDRGRRSIAMREDGSGSKRRCKRPRDGSDRVERVIDGRHLVADRLEDRGDEQHDQRGVARQPREVAAQREVAPPEMRRGRGEKKRQRRVQPGRRAEGDAEDDRQDVGERVRHRHYVTIRAR